MILAIIWCVIAAIGIVICSEALRNAHKDRVAVRTRNGAALTFARAAIRREVLRLTQQVVFFLVGAAAIIFPSPPPPPSRVVFAAMTGGALLFTQITIVINSWLDLRAADAVRRVYHSELRKGDK